MEGAQDFLIGRDIVLEELEPLSNLLDRLPLKAQFGPKNLVGHVWEKTKEYGVKSLFSTLKEKAHDNFKSIKIEYTCFDVSFDAVVLGTNLGIIFLYDRTCKSLSRLPSEITHEPARCVKLLPTHSYVAVGFSSGLITIFTFVLASQGFGKLQTLHVSGAHNFPVTCLEWSPDGELLYSGDMESKVYVTVIKFKEGQTQTAFMLEDTAPIVQLSYSWQALLISSEKRTLLWNFHSEGMIQVGQKERKSAGKYGACFYPPARRTSEEGSSETPNVFTARPGLRIWTADINGKVSATLMYKGLTSENPPGIKVLAPLPPCLSKHSPDFQAQFGSLLIYHGQFLVTWDVSRLWVLDTSPCSLVGFHSNLGDIVDVSTVGHEIYVLQRGGERLLMKLSLIPRLPNPLVDLTALTDHSYKDDNNHENGKHHEHTKSTSMPELTSKTEGETTRDTQVVDSAVRGVIDTPEADPFLKYQEIRHQDFGEIVFKKNKRSKKKNVKESSPSVAMESENQVLDHPNDISDEVNSFPSPPVPDDNHQASDLPDHYDPAVEAPSDISSDLDSAERNDGACSEPNQSGEGEDELPPITQPHLVVAQVSEASAQHKHDSNCEAKGDRNSTEGCVAHSVDADESSVVSSPSYTHSPVSNDTLTPEEHFCADSLAASMSSFMENKNDDDEDELLNPDESCQSDYLPDIYSNTPVNIFDATLSDVSVEKSPRSKSRLSKSSMSLIGSPPSTRASGDVQTDSEGTPPVSLDSEGAEELSDTASWPRSPTRRTASDFEILHHGNAFALEGSSSESSESSLSRSPVSTSLNLRLLADSWADYSPPGHGYAQFVAVSDTHIWCVTTSDHIFYCPTHFSVVTWTQLRGFAKMIAVNIAGDVIWCIDRKNYAYTRRGISSNHLTGKTWVPVEKDMRFVAIEDSSVWGIKLNGDVFVRTEVSREQPTGKGWRTIRIDTPFVHVSCLNGIVWFLDRINCIHVFKGVNPSKPAAKENWEILEDISAKWVCLGIEGVAWIVDLKGALWFTNVTLDSPTGSTWYQVSLGQYLMHDRGLLESLWSWVVRGDGIKLLTASPKAGVWLLGRGSSLQASHGHLLGTRWDPLTPQSIAQSVFWSYVSAGALKGDKGHVWALQPNGELICFQPGCRPIIVEPPKRKVLKLVSASGQNLWAITHNFKVVQRTGVSDLCPEGFGWVDLNLEQFGVGKVYHLSCGALSTWAVDDAGNVWLRIGKEDSQDPAVTQVWIPVDGSPLPGYRFAKVAVSPSDRVVWAVDDRNNVYARRDVTASFPIGTCWEVVPGTGVRDLAISEHMVWATCPNGDIVCRYGVSETNCVGHYWKKLPGNFELISVTADDELWAIDQSGRLFLRKTQHFYGTQSPFKPRTYSALFSGEDDWEFI